MPTGKFCYKNISEVLSHAKPEIRTVGLFEIRNVISIV